MKIVKGLMVVGVMGALQSVGNSVVYAEDAPEQQVLLEEETAIENAFEDEALLQVIREAVEANGHTELSSETLSEITKLTKVRELGITSLKGIELLTGLEELEMRSNEIEDISPISTLTQLKKLDLRENNLSSLAGIEPLTALKELDVRGSSIQSLEPLSGLINLEELDFRDNTVTDLSPLTALIQLKDLSARGNGIVDLTPIQGMTELEELNVHSNQVADLTPLTHLTKIKSLVLRRNQITDISPLAYLTLLEDLNIRDNQIQDISPLGNLENLTVRLNLDGNTGITDFSPIAHYYNDIQDVDFVLPNQDTVDLDDLEPLAGQERMNSLTNYMIESNQYIKDPSVREQKLNNLGANPFAFYRGTAALFFQDVKDQVIQIPDSWAPLSQARTWITGDLHVENIGFYGNRKKEAIFELNDFDEAAIAPFYFDLLNFGTSVYLLNDSAPGLQLTQPEIESVLESYSSAYRSAVANVVNGNIDVQEHYFTADNLEGFVGNYAAEVSETPLSKQLNNWTTITDDRVFDLTNSRLTEATAEEKDQLLRHWDTYLNSIDSAIVEEVGEDYFAIKDIARRTDAGLGSLGYDRFYILIEGATASINDDIILDVKAQGPSAVEASGLFDGSGFATDAERTITGVRALHNFLDIHWGTLETEDQSFLVKERTPFKDEIGASDFGGIEDLEQFVQISAEVTAYAHLRAAQAEGNRLFSSTVSNYFETQGTTFDSEFADISLNYYAQVLVDHRLYAELLAADAFNSPIADEIVEVPVEEIEEVRNEESDQSEEALEDIEQEQPLVTEEPTQSVEESEGTEVVEVSEPLIEKVEQREEASSDRQDRLPQTSYTNIRYSLYSILLISSGAILIILDKKRTKLL
ncbi:DUF2252 family protein [Marinilactibacillus sp. GCM10026970]|uniref:DUF2252 family protein n=1 Tax=Marinilactibacillus sp. GCM10026970 TaxID=3252642 RepID=UPI003613598A